MLQRIFLSLVLGFASGAALAHAVRALRACFGKSLDVRSAQRNGSGDAGGAGRRRMETAANASQGAAPRD